MGKSSKVQNLSSYPLHYIRKSLYFIKWFYKQYPKTSKLFTAINLLNLGFWALLYKLQNNLLYFPNVGYGRSNLLNPHNLRHPSHRGIQSSDIKIKTKDNVQLNGWHLMKQGADKLIVYFHGNAGNIGTRLPFAQKLMNQCNAQILLVGYRGYSDSQGTPSQRGLQLDSQSILEKARQIASQRKKSLFIFGTSLGGAVAVYAAGTQQNRKGAIKGLILQNTFTGTTEVLTTSVPFLKILSPILWLINRNPWYSLGRINRVSCPIFFIKCGKDEVVPPKMTDLLRQQCHKKHIHSYLYQIPEGNHNDAHIVNPKAYFPALNEFFNAVKKI